jgi:hypothetical protein
MSLSPTAPLPPKFRLKVEAVMAAYGWAKDLSESEVVARLFQMYESLIGK